MSLNPLSNSGYDLEEKYFFDLNQERIHDLKEERAKMEKLHSDKNHWMVCPKCGGQMVYKESHHVQIAVCDDCEAVTLDKGELKLLMDNIHKEDVYDKFRSIFL